MTNPRWRNAAVSQQLVGPFLERRVGISPKNDVNAPDGIFAEHMTHGQKCTYTKKPWELKHVAYDAKWRA